VEQCHEVLQPCSRVTKRVGSVVRRVFQDTNERSHVEKFLDSLEHSRGGHLPAVLRLGRVSTQSLLPPDTKLPTVNKVVTFDRMYGFASDTAELSFSMGLRNRFLAHGFKVTVLALKSSLLFDFVCKVVGASRAGQHLQEIPNVMDQRQNAAKSSPCTAKLCLSDKLQLLLDMSVQIDGAARL